jgi:hypothetical protein
VSAARRIRDILPPDEPAEAPRHFGPDFGPEPPGGWHRGVPGLRRRTPEELEQWLAEGGVYTAERYTPVWDDDDEDDDWGVV